MAAPQPHTGPVGPDSLITVKVLIDGTNRRFKLPLRDLGAHILPQKLRFLLAIPPESHVRFDRFSDSAGTYVTLDSNNPSVYKQLYRAAKAKLKLRLKATVIPPQRTVLPQRLDPVTVNIMDEEHPKTELDKIAPITTQPKPLTFFDAVSSQPTLTGSAAPSFKSFQQSCSANQYIKTTNTNTWPTMNKVTDIQQSSSRAPPPPPARNTRIEELSRPTLPSIHDFAGISVSIECNHCNKHIPNEHYHCSICEGGDYDLCQSCIDSGITCQGDEHWLIKRFIRNGMLFPSVTETVPPRTTKTPLTSSAAAKNELVTPVVPQEDDNERTCNSCISQLPGHHFVTCKDCPDFDLCLPCFRRGEHGHHPGHIFESLERRANLVDPTIRALCESGRGVIHDAICDGCDKHIVGVRYKCLSCPDWDYCSTCISTSADTHSGHRFAPLFEPLGGLVGRQEHHRGIFCDGPLCATRSKLAYIRGDRYKCAVCDDVDFCANCEALPSNPHNKTHPLIKFRTSVRHVSISTTNTTPDGAIQLGDRPAAKHASTETIRSTSTNAATQVQTLAEVKPAETVEVPAESNKTLDLIKDSVPSADLQAWYESDSTPDGSNFAPNRLVSQSWTLRNPGPDAWPAGCAVHFIGGDDMRNLDAQHPSSVTSMVNANRSNVLEYSLQAGKTAVFTVLLKSPAREGRSISYWRLKTPEGVPFGHKLWVDINVKSTPVELPVRSAPASTEGDVTPKAEEIEVQTEESSTMIFPKLDKESPMSSVHDVTEAPTAVVALADDQDLLEDVESLELGEDDSEEDGFMTDEEYDILDASDEDFLMEAQAAVNRK